MDIGKNAITHGMIIFFVLAGNLEIFKLAWGIAEVNISFLDIRTEMIVNFIHKPLDRPLLTFDGDLNPTIRQISRPTHKAEGSRDTMGRITKAHPLHHARIKNMRLHHY